MLLNQFSNTELLRQRLMKLSEENKVYILTPFKWTMVRNTALFEYYDDKSNHHKNNMQKKELHNQIITLFSYLKEQVNRTFQFNVTCMIKPTISKTSTDAQPKKYYPIFISIFRS